MVAVASWSRETWSVETDELSPRALTILQLGEAVPGPGGDPGSPAMATAVPVATLVLNAFIEDRYDSLDIWFF